MDILLFKREFLNNFKKNILIFYLYFLRRMTYKTLIWQCFRKKVINKTLIFQQFQGFYATYPLTNGYFTLYLYRKTIV
jgi:hypothetical protein